MIGLCSVVPETESYWMCPGSARSLHTPAQQQWHRVKIEKGKMGTMGHNSHALIEDGHKYSKPGSGPSEGLRDSSSGLCGICHSLEKKFDQMTGIQVCGLSQLSGACSRSRVL